MHSKDILRIAKISNITTFFKKCELKIYDKTEIKSDFADMAPLNVNETSFIWENFQWSGQPLPRPKNKRAQNGAQSALKWSIQKMLLQVVWEN